MQNIVLMLLLAFPVLVDADREYYGGTIAVGGMWWVVMCGALAVLFLVSTLLCWEAGRQEQREAARRRAVIVQDGAQEGQHVTVYIDGTPWRDVTVSNDEDDENSDDPLLPDIIV